MFTVAWSEIGLYRKCVMKLIRGLVSATSAGNMLESRERRRIWAHEGKARPPQANPNIG